MATVAAGIAGWALSRSARRRRPSLLRGGVRPACSRRRLARSAAVARQKISARTRRLPIHLAMAGLPVKRSVDDMAKSSVISVHPQLDEDI